MTEVGLPPAQMGEACRNCGRAIRAGNTSTGWTHVGGWQGVRCPGDLCGAAPRRSPEDVLERVDAAVEGRCPCGADPRPGSAWCSPDCEPTHRGPDTDAWGSGPPTAARWRPDLVTVFDDTGLTLLDSTHRDDTGLDYRVYTDSESVRAFLRVDDGHRFVGLEVPWSELEASGPSGSFRRLERELGDRRRLDPEPSLPPAPLPVGQTTEEFAAAATAWHRLLWIPNPPADPDAPTPAELAGGVDLTPNVAAVYRERVPRYSPAGQSSTGMWVDEARRLFGIPVVVSPNVPPDQVLVVGEGGQRTILTADPDRLGRAVAGTLRTRRRWREAVVWFTAWLIATPLWAWLMMVVAGAGLGDRHPYWAWLLLAGVVPPACEAISRLWRLGKVRWRRRRPRVNLRVDTSQYEEGMAQASEAFRRAGEQIATAGPPIRAVGAAAAGLGRAVAAAVQAESDRVALRAVCSDEAMYERALVAAEERGVSVQQMFCAVAEGRYTDSGWSES